MYDKGHTIYKYLSHLSIFCLRIFFFLYDSVTFYNEFFFPLSSGLRLLNNPEYATVDVDEHGTPKVDSIQTYNCTGENVKKIIIVMGIIGSPNFLQFCQQNSNIFFIAFTFQ